MAALKEEAKARGLKVRASLNKPELLKELGDGSVALNQTPQYHYVQAVLALIPQEASALVNQQRDIVLKQRAKYEAEWAEEASRAKQTIREHNAALHTCEAPLVHPHPLAPTAQLKDWPWGAKCKVCQKRAHETTCEWTCTACDFNICRTCFEIESLPEAERDARRQAVAAAETRKRKEGEEEAEKARKRQKIERKEREAEAEKERKRQKTERDKNQEEAEKERKRQRVEREKTQDKALGKFPPHVRDLAEASKQRSSKGYTVWRSSWYRADGWHSYAGAPRKEFDSCFKTAKDANTRAKFLFFVENTGGLSVQEMLAMYPGSDSFGDSNGVSGEIDESYTEARPPPPQTNRSN